MPETLTERLFWSGHANPASVWTAVAAYPLLVLGLYRRDRRVLAGAAGTVALSSLLAPEPEDDSAFGTRVVLGERVWLDRGLLSAPGELLFVLLGVPLQLFVFRSALRQQPVRTALATPLAMILMFVFFARMVRLYDQAQETERPELSTDAGV